MKTSANSIDYFVYPLCSAMPAIANVAAPFAVEVDTIDADVIRLVD